MRGDSVGQRLRNCHERSETGFAATLLCGHHAHHRGPRGSRQAGIHECHGRGACRAGGCHGVLGHAGLLADRHRDQSAAPGQCAEPHANARLAGVNDKNLPATPRKAILEQSQHRPCCRVAGDDDGSDHGQGRHEGLHAFGAETGSDIFERQAIGVEHLNPTGASLRADHTHAQARPVSLAHRALQFGVARVAQRLREPHNRGGTAVRGLGDLMRGNQRKFGQVIDQVARERLLGGAEPLVVAAEDLCEFGCVGWHVRQIRRGYAGPFPCGLRLMA